MKKILIIGLIVVVGCAQAVKTDVGKSESMEIKVTQTQAEKITQLIKQLVSADWKERESAQEKLRKIGTEVLPYVTKATRDPDPEKALRARRIFKELTDQQKREALKLSLSTDKDVYEVGENITINCKLTNLGKEPVVIYSGDVGFEDSSVWKGLIIHYAIIYPDGTEWSTGESSAHGCYGIHPVEEKKLLTLDPGAKKTIGKKVIHDVEIKGLKPNKYKIRIDCLGSTKLLTDKYFASDKAKELWSKVLTFNKNAELPIEISTNKVYIRK